MGATKKIKKILIDKEVNQEALAQATGRELGTLRNMLSRDNMKYSTVEDICKALGFEIVFREIGTGRIYD